MNGLPLSASIKVDDLGDVIEIYGIRYSGELFRGLGFAAKGTRFEVGERASGVVTLHRIDPLTEQTNANRPEA